MRAGLALLLGLAAATAALPATLAEQATELRAQYDQARSGKLIEYHLARSGLESCERALRLFGRDDREFECREAERRVAACDQRREAWSAARERFAADATAAGQAARHAALLKLSLPECPARLPNGQGPGAALIAANRREREALPNYPVCESLLRATISAADTNQPVLVEGLARELVERCGAEHPDYRRQADAALIRVGREPALLDAPRGALPAASAASSL